MKLLFASDIHGSYDYCKKVIERFEEGNFEQLILLGDLLNHGPRNPLPSGYDPLRVSELLNKYKDKIICVRGNCDSEVDQMLFKFPMMADYTILYCDGLRIFATHGHLFNEDHLPCLSNGDVLIYGHFHIPLAKQNNEGIYILNPSSASLAKEGKNSYATYENGVFTILDFDGIKVKEIELIHEQFKSEVL